MQVRRVEIGGDRGKFIGRRPRGPEVIRLEHDLDISRQQSGPTDRILRFLRYATDCRESEIDPPLR